MIGELVHGFAFGQGDVAEAVARATVHVQHHPRFTAVPVHLQTVAGDDQRTGIAGVFGQTLEDAGQCRIAVIGHGHAQLGDMGDVIRGSRADKIVIDHHVGEDDLNATMYKDYQSEATGHLVVQAADALGVPMTRSMAMPLFTAIATDTGWFRFSSVTAETYRTIARLIDAGVVPCEVYGDLYERDSLGRVRLRGLVLSRTKAEIGGTLMHTYVEKEDFEAMGALPNDTEDVVNLTLAVKGAQAAVIFVGQTRGGFKLSFRSQGALDCNHVARHFGGGGHKAAAGAFVEGNLDEVQDRVLPIVRDAMRVALGYDG